MAHPTKKELQDQLDTLRAQLDGIDPRPAGTLESDHAFLGLMIEQLERIKRYMDAWSLDDAYRALEDLIANLNGVKVERRAEIARARVPESDLF